MMKRHLALLVLSVVFAIGLVPTAAFAAEGDLATGGALTTGNDLTAGDALVADGALATSSDLATGGCPATSDTLAFGSNSTVGGSSATSGVLTTQASTTYAEVVSPASGASCYAGRTIQVKAKLNLYVNGVYNYLCIEVLKGSKRVAFEATRMDNLGSATLDYKPTSSGAYKVRASAVYGSSTMPTAVDEDNLAPTVTFKVPGASSIKSVTPKIATAIRLSNKSAVIGWSGALGTGVKVYRATSKNGKYKRVATTSDSSFTNKKLKKKQVYYYKIRYYYKCGNKTCNSKYSIAKKVGKYSDIAEATIYSASYSESEGVTLKWVYGKNCVSQSVIRRPGKHEIGLMITSVGSKVRVATDDTATKGSTYYYSVIVTKKEANGEETLWEGPKFKYTVPL